MRKSEGVKINTNMHVLTSVYSMNKKIIDSYCVSGTVLGPVDTEVKKAQSSTSRI